MYHGLRIYVVALAAEVSALMATDKPTPTWVLVLVAVVAPTIPVVIGYLLTQRKIREVHVLVNSRLSRTLDRLADSLVAIIVLKEKYGEPVTDVDRTKAQEALAEQKEQAS